METARLPLDYLFALFVPNFKSMGSISSLFLMIEEVTEEIKDFLFDDLSAQLMLIFFCDLEID